MRPSSLLNRIIPLEPSASPPTAKHFEAVGQMTWEKEREGAERRKGSEDERVSSRASAGGCGLGLLSEAQSG